RLRRTAAMVMGRTGMAISCTIKDHLGVTLNTDSAEHIAELILAVLLRAIVAPLYLLGTVILNYLASLGIGVLIFQWALGYEIAWPVPLLAFIILVAVGADYNMLLISRLREESGTNIRVGVLRTVANTGSVITSAGLIFAASMFGLMIGSIAIMIQVGLIIGCGLLLDTFLVRTLTVPAIATLLRENSWWPHKQHPRRQLLSHP
ncbi:MMPL family transporter, partial [Mycobacterium tuberculosis]|uniref:MMPL family transporter n=1 Tax=Mycobacterium tuberculosis TaxID=1773 RepID=UPI001F3F8DFE